MDGNVKLILGMIWSIILRFSIAEISEEGLTAKEGQEEEFTNKRLVIVGSKAYHAL